MGRRVLANRRRGHRRRDALHERLRALPPESAPDPADRLGEAEAVRRAFAALSDDDRETLALAAWEGLTPAEASQVVGCSAHAFSARLSRARSRLAREMDSGAAPIATHDARGGTT